MDAETTQRLIALNHQFYQTFAAHFSATRQRLQPGVLRMLPSILAARLRRTIIAMLSPIQHAVHLVGRMAGEAGHATFDPVDIGRHAVVFALVFILDPRAMAASAGQVHGRRPFE